jgi:hypothetical protein
MQITYVGPFDEVEFDVTGPLGGRTVLARKGEPVEVPDALGESLLEQEHNWATTAAVAHKPDGAEPGAPAQSALKAEWVAFAVSRGADPTQAEAATKAELIDTYGTKEP